MRYIKHTIFCLIIFSNTCFGKEFDKLFVVYEPIESSSQIEKSINNSFNTMIYRLSGNNSPSNIWKIINAGNSRKDFITSYSIKNFENKSYLEVNFDKDLLISQFNKLSIPLIGNSRPVILFLINIDSGLEEPYFLTNNQSKSEIDILIKNYLKEMSSQRGIFLELPELDLIDINELNNYGKLINSNKFFNDKYISDDLISISISKTGISEWSVNGSVELNIDNQNFVDIFMKEFINYTNQSIDNLLNKSRIDVSDGGLINISIDNVNTLQDYKKSREVIQNLVGAKDISINKFNIDTIHYQLSIYGSFNSLLKEISENNFLQVIDVYEESSSIHLSFQK